MDGVSAELRVRVTLDEPSIKRRAVLPVARTPKIVVTFGFQLRCDFSPRSFQTAHLDQDIDNRFRGEPWDRSAPKVLNAPDKVSRQVMQELLLFLPKKLRPSRVVGSYVDIFADYSLNALSEGFHFPSSSVC
jgi:hypothetical protein